MPFYYLWGVTSRLIKLVKIPLSLVIVLYLLIVNLKNYGYLVGLAHIFYSCLPCLQLIHSWILSRSQQSPIHHTWLNYLLSCYPILLLSILVNQLLTSPGSCTQDLLLTVYHIHDFNKCMTGIFSFVMDDDVIHDSCLLEKSTTKSLFSSTQPHKNTWGTYIPTAKLF